MTETAMVVAPVTAIAHRYELTVEDVIAQAHKIQEIASKAMKDGEHYGVIPGTQKPTLLQPGAQKLMLTFRLDPQYASVEMAPDLGGGGHLTIKSTCTLYHIPTQERLGSGEGSCSTREEKYAYRKAARKCPLCNAEAIIKGKEEYGGGWVCFAKKGGCGAKYKDGDGEIESQAVGQVANERLPDSYNSVLKIANKRALVAAILNVTAASDVFTQDLEDVTPTDPATVATASTPQAGTRAPNGNDEREATLASIMELSNKLGLKSAERAALWEKHVGPSTIDPRSVDPAALSSLLTELKGRVK